MLLIDFDQKPFQDFLKHLHYFRFQRYHYIVRPLSRFIWNYK